MEGNAPICNLGASGTPLKYSLHGDASIPLKEVVEPDSTGSDTKPEPIRDPDTYMINNVDDCQWGLKASQYADADAGAEVVPATPPQGKAEVTAATKGKGREASAPVRRSRKIQRNIQRTPALVGGSNGKLSRYKTPEEDTHVNAFREKKEKEERMSAQGDKGSPKHTGPAKPVTSSQHMRQLPGTGANATPLGSRPGTGANATPIRQLTPTPRAPRQLTEGKPGRIQRTRPGNRGFWNPGPENTADIESECRPTSVQVLITGYPTVPGRGDAWKKSFLASFNAKRERLAPDTPICATQVSFARSYPSERVITIHHPPNTEYGEIISAVARVRREIYNTYIQHPNDGTTSILQETTELVALGLQGMRGEKAWDRADEMCKSLNLIRTARPAKWLVKGKGDGYEGTKCSLRFTVTTASLRAIKSPLPIVHNKGRIYLYQREGDRAFYVDELKYMVTEPLPFTLSRTSADLGRLYILP